MATLALDATKLNSGQLVQDTSVDYWMKDGDHGTDYQVVTLVTYDSGESVEYAWRMKVRNNSGSLRQYPWATDADGLRYTFKDPDESLIYRLNLATAADVVDDGDVASSAVVTITAET